MGAIRVATAHDYVKALHQYYGAHSRGELMAYHLGRTPSLRTSSGDEMVRRARLSASR